MNMKTGFLLAAIPAALLTFTVACDGATTTDCAVDADCVGTTNSVGDATPICDETLLICVADGGVDECAEALDCQILDGSDGAGCEASADCPEDEACVEGFGGEGFCVVTGGADVCDLVDGFETASLPEVGGGNIDVCIAEDGTCTDGACDL
jgi:hypothetical protein